MATHFAGIYEMRSSSADTDVGFYQTIIDSEMFELPAQSRTGQLMLAAEATIAEAEKAHIPIALRRPRMLCLPTANPADRSDDRDVPGHIGARRR